MFNIPVPVFFLAATSGGATFGMWIAVGAQIVVGVFAVRKFPRTLSAIVIGGVLTALSQLYPLLQMMSGIVALTITGTLISGASAFGGGNPATSFMEGFSATWITAFIEITVAAAFGGVVQWLRSLGKITSSS